MRWEKVMKGWLRASIGEIRCSWSKANILFSRSMNSFLSSFSTISSQPSRSDGTLIWKTCTMMANYQRSMTKYTTKFHNRNNKIIYSKERLVKGAGDKHNPFPSELSYTSKSKLQWGSREHCTSKPSLVHRQITRRHYWSNYRYYLFCSYGTHGWANS